MIVAINTKAKSIPVPLLMRITAIMFFLLMLSITTSYQMALAQRKQTSSSGNVTAQIEPQGTSLRASNATTASGSSPSSTSGNVTALVKPQGTSLQNANQSTVGGGPSHR